VTRSLFPWRWGQYGPKGDRRAGTVNGNGREEGATHYALARERMVQEQLERRGIRDPGVLTAMRKVPRHVFVDPSQEGGAYEDTPLPIGEGQTISQPYMVAIMTEALSLCGDESVLEIGTGSGYQTAILAELADRVYSIERIPALAERAGSSLERLGYKNVSIRVGDGSLGWPEAGPWPAIIVTAGAPVIPQPLVDQLAVGGRLVVPVGTPQAQTLRRVLKTEEGTEQEELVGCVFVKLVGEHGWSEDE